MVPVPDTDTDTGPGPGPDDDRGFTSQAEDHNRHQPQDHLQQQQQQQALKEQQQQACPGDPGRPPKRFRYSPYDASLDPTALAQRKLQVGGGGARALAQGCSLAVLALGQSFAAADRRTYLSAFCSVALTCRTLQARQRALTGQRGSFTHG